MANEALESLQRTLKQILQRDDDLTTRRLKLQIICIHDKAVVLQLNLIHFPEEEGGETFMEVADTAAGIIHYLFSPANLSNCGSTAAPAARLSEQLGQLASELESTVGAVVDYCISSSTSDGDRLKLPMELAAQISNRFGRLFDKIMSTLLYEYVSDTELAVVSSSSTPEPVVRFKEDTEHPLLQQLLSSSSERRCIVSIVGMAGIGKSRLAKMVSEHVVNKDSYDINVWITMSQDSTVESVVSNLLALLEKKTTQFISLSDSIKEICWRLYGKRYHILLDDLRSTQLWDYISQAFPDNANGSRILLTTRLMDVANHCSRSIHVMRLLDEQQSWDLFQREAFADQTCPLELQPVAKNIVKGCGGLPLSIVTKARHLSMFDKTPKIWQQIGANDAQLATITSSSYNDLPQRLRPCFLYMAAFPGDYEIHASEIIKLWIAEGFLDCSDESKSLEQVGEAYLEDIVEKNLVLVTSKKIDGIIQKCRLHSTVRDFCVRQSERVKFLLPVMDYLPTPILRRHFLPQVVENYRCIGASWYDLDLRDSMQSSCTKTIICIPQKGYRPKVSVPNFTSLRVLHVLRRQDHFYWELGQVFDLIHLTYLASNIPTSIVPPAISKLQYLQTLIIYRHEVLLPVEIWRLRRLRHLIAFSFHPLPHPEKEACPLIHLQTLCLATDFVCCARMVEMIPNIRKLGICYSESEEILDEGYYCLDNISLLIQLEKLKLERRSLIWPSLNPHFPQSLKKLTLSGWRLPWSDMVIVGRLPHLEVLKLRNYAFDGECWETEEGGFAKLILLLIDESNLQHWNTESSHFPSFHWNTESSHFPRLQSLMLYRCPYLHELPFRIHDMLSLKLIEIDDSNQFLLSLAKMMQVERLEVRVRAVHL